MPAVTIADDRPAQAPTPVFSAPLDLNAIFRKGFQRLRLDAGVADTLLAATLRQRFAAAETPDLGPHAKRHAHRHGVTWLGDRAAEPFVEIAGRLTQPILAVLEPMFGPLTVGQPNLFDCRPGYWMEWHDHLSQRSVLDLLVYLSDGDIPESDGGALEVARCWRDGAGAITGRVPIGRFVPTHGDVVLIDAQTPLFQHRVETYRGSKSRFLFSVPIGGASF